MTRSRRLALLLCLAALPAALRAGTGGPDSADITYVDSDEADGPPSTLLDMVGATDPNLGDAGSATVALPFAVDLYGSAVSSLTLSNDGAVFFDGALPVSSASCPGSTATWSGVAAFWDDWGADAVTYAVRGRYPNRAFVAQWSGPHGTAGGDGLVQAWLLEGSPQAVIVIDDATFGAAAVDGGASAIVGVHGGTADGLAWSCAGGLVDGTSAWFGPAAARPASPDRLDSDLSTPWSGTSTNQYAGNALSAGHVDGDGLAEVLVGDSAGNKAYLLVGGEDVEGAALTGAAASFTKTGSTALGTAVLLADLDGDGLDEVIIGAPEDSTVAASAGMVWVVQGGTVGGAYSFPSGADLSLRGPTAAVAGYTRTAALYQRARAGKALAAGDLNGDGTLDLVIGAPEEDSSAINAGAVFLEEGGASFFAASSASLNSADAVFVGEATNDNAGLALATADVDGDGDDDLAVGAPYVDATAGANAGRAYLVDGGALSGTYALATKARATLSGGAGSDELGWGLAFADIDADGALDWFVGAPRADSGATNGGAVYGFYTAAGLSGALTAGTSEDLRVAGDTASMGAGSALARLDTGSASALVVAAPNDPAAISGGGSVAVFRSLPAGTTLLSAADHRVYGTTSAGALGTALAVADDHQGDGYPDLLVGAPYAEVGGVTGAGAVYTWSFLPSFVDADGDAFVDVAAGGLDCDDADASVNLNAAEVAGNGKDDDCDGWIDDALILRTQDDPWLYDIDAELGVSDSELFDFEDASLGAALDSQYLSRDLAMSGSGSVAASADVWGALPVDGQGAAVAASGGLNELDLVFGAPVDALSLRVLDGQGVFHISLLSEGVIVYEGDVVELDADNRSYGVPVGLTFAASVDEVILSGEATDAFGIDDLMVVWAADTDRDGDGYTDGGGDCDDGDAAVNPAATEDLTNGLDDDCDGVIDGGSFVSYTSETDFVTAAGFTPTRVDFEGLATGLSITTSYATLGLQGDGGLIVSTDVDGAAPIGAAAASLAAGASTTITFDEVQPAVALSLLDVGSGATLTGRAGGVDLYTISLAGGGDDVAGGVFVGLTFEFGVDELVLTADSSLDIIGVDDILFHPLGLDDADGDGFTEATGDCDDSLASTRPTATETWYDGVDADCGGDSDFDADGDGVDARSGGGGDCDDAAITVYPGATETWYDGVDGDCDALSDYDADLDGHDSLAFGGDDCADADAAISPEAAETWYDGVDDDCLAVNDDDADGDGWAASGYSGGALGSGDCDDHSASVSPSATDAWYDGVDADCSGSSDLDADGDGFDSAGYGGDDCDDGNQLVNPSIPTDRCYDGVDADCDGLSDYDCDGDGADAAAYGGTDCEDADAAIHPGAYDDPNDGIDANCDGVNEFDDDLDGYDDALRGGDDCDDTQASVHPGATELWYDGVDSDCDGLSDYDADADSYDSSAYGGGDCDDADGSVYPSATDYAYDGLDADCAGDNDNDADGDGYEADWYGGTDCDDQDATVHPGAAEVWYDGVDGDCAGDADTDADGDGVDAIEAGGDDCDDADPSTYPGALDLGFDGIDQDCSGADSRDGDGDGVALEADCDDADPAVFPGAVDPCYDGVDADCGGEDDDDCDGDGVVASAQGGTDCDDADPSARPGAAEIWYDGVDSACDGGDDFDQDGDGHRVDTWGGDDCDDTDAAQSPAATETCNGVDDNCDGAVDEGCEITDGSDGTDGGDGGAGDDSAAPDPNDGFTPPEGKQIEDGKFKNSCSTAGSPASLAGLLVGAVALLRRRRRA